MAKIIWHDNASSLLDYHINQALVEYGKSTAMRWKDEISAFEERVRIFPESYTPEELLNDRQIIYRRRHIMNNNSKDSKPTPHWENAHKDGYLQTFPQN